LKEPTSKGRGEAKGRKGKEEKGLRERREGGR